jgi:hypothetical protein
MDVEGDVLSDGETGAKNVVGDAIEEDIEIDDHGAENGSDHIKTIKEKLTSLLRACDGTWASDAKFPWKDMPPRLAACGVKLVNWPENVPLPGTERGAARRSKGISALTHNQQKALVAALKDPTNPLHFEKADKSGMYHRHSTTTVTDANIL